MRMHRYMGTMVGISDLDPLRWPVSKWRNLQVEWDEPGCCGKQNREQQTEWGNLIKRPFIRVPEMGNGNSFPYSISNLCLEQLLNMLLKPQLFNQAGTLAALQQQSAANGDLIADMKTMQAKLNQKKYISTESNPPQSSIDQSAAINVNTSHAILPGKLNNLTKFGSQSPVENSTDKTKLDTDFSADQLSQLNSTGQGIEDKLAAGFVSPYNLVNQLTFANQNQSAAQLQTSPRPMQPPLESLLYHSQQTN
ncbi:hypothetical protein ACE6H2_006790 [Prunus campanulata]